MYPARRIRPRDVAFTRVALSQKISAPRKNPNGEKFAKTIGYLAIWYKMDGI